MTYLNSRPYDMTVSNIAKTFQMNVAEAASLFQMLVTVAMQLLAKFARARGPKTRNALLLTLAVLAALHGGTREEKRAFLQDLIAKSNARLEVLVAKYRVWRQRKCWMWGGGLLVGALAALLNVFEGARDLTSFEALIPD